MNKRRIIIAFSVCALVFTAFPVSAAGIVPDSLVPECSKLSGGCTLCDAWPLADNIIKFLLFGLAIPVLTVTLIWGGVMWTTAGASPSNIEQGKKIMTSGIIGILIAFSGWLAVDTVIKSLASGGKVVGAWQTFPKREDCINPNLADEQFKFQDIVPGASPAEPTAGRLTHEQAKQRLDAASISLFSTTGCTNGSKAAGCTSLEGIQAIVIDEVVSFKNLCNCSVTVTGGTEAGHSTTGSYNHGNGYKIDIDAADNKSDAASRFIIRATSIFEPTLPRGTSCHDAGPRYTKNDNKNIDYSFESCPSHWDITVKP